MARAFVTTQKITKDGLDVALTAPAIDPDGDSIESGNVVLVVDNADAAAKTVTVITPLTVQGLNVEDLSVNVPATTRLMIGPFPRNVYGQPSTANESGQNDGGRVYVNYGANVTGVTRGVVAL